ncbi:hypothetical protein [Desulfocicer vacuolatum]|nr:hypothetical protein [Desulfocicer vacuolatum]
MTLLLIIFFLYLFQRQRTALITGLQGSVASLSVKEERLIENIRQLNEDKSKVEDYIQNQKQDLLRLNTEQARHAKLRTELDEMTRQLLDNRAQSDSLRATVATLEIENRLLNDNKNEIQSELSLLASRRDELTEKIEECNAEFQDQKQQNKNQLIELQREHEKSLEEQQNINTRLFTEAEEEHKKRVEQLLEQIRKPILEKKETIAALEVNIQALNDELEALTQRRQEASEHLQGLNSNIDKKEVRLQSLGTECGNKERWISDAQDKIQGLLMEIKELEEVYNELLGAQNELTNIKQIVDDLKKTKLQLDTDCQKKEALCSNIADMIEQLEMDKNDAVAEFKGHINGLEVEKTKKESQIESLREELLRLQQAKKDLLEIESRIVDLTVRLQLLESNCSQKQGNLETLKELEQQKNDLLATLSSKINDHEAAIDEMNNTRNKSQADLDSLISKIEDRREELVKIEKGINRLENEKNRLEDELKKMKKMKQPGDNIDSIEDLLKKPACFDATIFPAESLHTDEVQMLQNFKQSLRNDKLFFHDRVINAFHTSLKCVGINPLTVLAGISGTGKTLLPIKYAQFMGMHQLILSVQPRWDSPQDMFGFYNYLENRYKATDLSRALVRMDEYNSFGDVGGTSKDRMLMVLMDEMNLARTEYYFSEFLSKLELRREIRDFSDFSDRQKGEIVLDVGPGLKEMSRLWVGSNVLFVGTMNEDESTLSLSDKVLDRSNVLRFGKPEKVNPQDYYFIDVPDAGGFLPHDLWQNHWIKKYDAIFPWTDKVGVWTDEINKALHKVSRAFGFRTESAIKAYVANYPESGEIEGVYKQAFADQVEQKILPRVRGLELMDQHSQECLMKIQDVVNSLEDKELANAFKNAMENNHLGLFQWNGVPRSLEV